METSLFNRLQLSLLAVATAGLVLLAVLNLRQESQSQVPDDGVWWVEAHGGSGRLDPAGHAQTRPNWQGRLPFCART